MSRQSELLSRLGGEEKLHKVVAGAYDGMKKHPRLGKFFARFRMEHLVQRTVDYMGSAMGGKPYSGPDLFLAHSHLMISDDHWRLFESMFATWLGKVGCSGSTKEDVMRLVHSFYDECVDPLGRHRENYLNRVEKTARDLDNRRKEEAKKKEEQTLQAWVEEQRRLAKVLAKPKVIPTTRGSDILAQAAARHAGQRQGVSAISQASVVRASKIGRSASSERFGKAEDIAEEADDEPMPMGLRRSMSHESNLDAIHTRNFGKLVWNAERRTFQREGAELHVWNSPLQQAEAEVPESKKPFLFLGDAPSRGGQKLTLGGYPIAAAARES